MQLVSLWKFLKNGMSKLPVERGATTTLVQSFCDEHGSFDRGVHQELEVAAVFLVTFATVGKSNSDSEAEPGAEKQILRQAQDDKVYLVVLRFLRS